MMDNKLIDWLTDWLIDWLTDIINKVINEKYTKTKHKTYYSNEYYLINIFEMLNDINKWITLKKLKSYNPVFIN